MMPPHSKLPKPVWILSWVSFFADVSSEMVYPLLPLFLVGIVGASKMQLGAMEGAAVLLVALLSAFAGIRSDLMKSRGRRTIWIRWGYGLPVLGKAIIAAATAFPMVIGGRMLDRFGKGIRGAPRDALISDAVTEDQRGRAFGLHRAFDTAGALLGVLISAMVLWWLTGTPQPSASPELLAQVETPAWVYRVIFGVAAFLGLASLVLTFFVREPEEPAEPEEPEEPAASAVPLTSTATAVASWLGLPKPYWLVLLLLVVFSLANSSDTFLLLRVLDLGYSPIAVVLAYAVYNVAYSVLSYPLGALSDRIGRWRIIASGWLIYALVYACFAWLPVQHAWAAWPLMAFYGVYMALTDGIGKALIADHAPRNRRGTAMGLYYAATGVTMLAASLLAGVAWDYSGPTLSLMIGASFALAALLTLYIFRSAVDRIQTSEIV
ncbi:MAG: MFS transporter [Pirellulaceae bacterium]|nr:MFS transporter [Pirellulaceae bacterium]